MKPCSLLLAFAISSMTSACASEPSGTASRCSAAEPPPVVLRTLAGEQIGVHGSYCTKQVGCGLCIDSAEALRRFTLVRPGEEAVFSMPEGALVAGQRCEPSCPPTLRIRSVGCDSSADEQRPIAEDEPWIVDLDPGTYSVWLDSHFEGADGWGGQIHVGFGLRVDTSHDPTVVDAVFEQGTCKEDDLAEPDAG